ncbi:MAG: SGNH/GDSL hydrolase family protein [Cyanobacteria bacterium P01_H01_bin.121]
MLPKYLLVMGGIAIGLLALAEVSLRWLLGFGTPLIYEADPNIGYLPAPDQQIRRLGRRIHINSQSMRSRAIAPAPIDGTWRILMLGDSIINGGWWTDQAATIPALLELSLNQNQATSKPERRTIEVLNASANSWGPRNEVAYVERFGLFGAQTVILVLNTDDLFGRKPSPLIVGRDRNYPAQHPPTALSEVFERYWRQPKPDPELQALNQALNNEGGDRVGINLEAIAKLQQLVKAADSQFLLIMTPLKRELQQTEGPRDYEVVARQRLQDWATANGVTYIDVLPVFNQTVAPTELYRDHIHLSPRGNYVVRDLLRNALTAARG